MIELANPAVSCKCDLCQEQFPSKSKLFKHLGLAHGIVSASAKPLRIVVLVGWLSDRYSDLDGWVSEQNTTSDVDSFMNSVEKAIFLAVHALDNNLSEVPQDLHIDRPKGFSRASGHYQRSSIIFSSEQSCHSQADSFCFLSQPYPAGDQAWVDKMNSLLPPSIRVLHRCEIPSEHARDFHAETSCSQRRYEYLIPLNDILPKHIEAPAVPIVKKKYQEEQIRNGTLPISLNSAMDVAFPLETEEGQARVGFFRLLKHYFKLFSGSRMYFHNFVTGRGSPEDGVCFRKLDRVFHKELVSVEGESWALFNVTGDALLRGQARRVLGLALACAHGFLPEQYLHATLHPQRVVEIPAVPGRGLYLAECRYAFFEARFVENKGDMCGSKGLFKLDPRRLQTADCSALSEWRSVVHRHVAQLAEREERLYGNWFKVFRTQCGEMLARFEEMNRRMFRPLPALKLDWEKQFKGNFPEVIPPPTISLLEEESMKAPSEKKQKLDESKNPLEVETPTDIVPSDSPAPLQIPLPMAAPYTVKDGYQGSLSNAPVAYQKVLRLLREADASGLWPTSSVGRQKVIVQAETVETGSTEEKGTEGEKEKTQGKSNDKGKEKSKGKGSEVKKGTRREGEKVERGKDKRKKNKNKTETKTESESNVESVDPSAMEETSTVHEEVVGRNETNKTSHEITGEGGQTGEGEVVGENEKASGVWEKKRGTEEAGGSFSVGCLPKHLIQPKGNDLFPELLKACFELERELLPNRPPSATIAINRHAQFKPHRDSGAGAGQTRSLIVALGDFIGGEIAVDNIPHDIRYSPLEFDGWNQQHWTLPFVGERYSLVWFTPLGIEQEDLWWWK